MPTIVDMLSLPDAGPLVELADELDGILSVIAYDGKNKDLKFIRECQIDIKHKYKHWIEENRPKEVDIASLSRWGFMLRCVIDAYDGFQDLLRFTKNKATIREDAENLLHENLIHPDPTDPDYQAPWLQ